MKNEPTEKEVEEAAEMLAVILLRSLEESLIAKKELLNSENLHDKESNGTDRLGNN
jgi:hypothetical protein